MSWFKLKEPMGTNYRVDPGDIVNTKRALNRLGYYKAPPERGIDDWTDDAMFNGIRSFQKDHALKVDGFMRPEGPTEKTINQKLAAVGGGANNEPDQESCAQAVGGLPLGRGWGTFGTGGGKGGGKCPRPSGDDDCDAQYADDGRTCNRVTERLGKEAGARCWRSANERYAACIAKRPEPPLSGGW